MDIKDFTITTRVLFFDELTQSHVHTSQDKVLGHFSASFEEISYSPRGEIGETKQNTWAPTRKAKPA